MKKDKLSPIQSHFIEVFAEQANIDKTRQELSISQESLDEWMKEPLFQSELEKVRQSLVKDAIQLLNEDTLKATAKLLRLETFKNVVKVKRSSLKIINRMIDDF